MYIEVVGLPWLNVDRMVSTLEAISEGAGLPKPK